jgi:orsellinic acid C2-O-methyltransferase
MTTMTTTAAFDAADSDARERLLALINAAWTTHAIHATCVLGLPALMAGGARTVTQLGDAAQCHAPSLRRLLRALATLGLCREDDAGRFELTPLGALLQSDHEQSLQAWALLSGSAAWTIRWGELDQSVRSGSSHRRRTTGSDGFDHLRGDTSAAALFNRAMVEVTRRAARDVLRLIDFSDARCIVDVGGGHGELLAAILRAHPAARGVLFDLPHAIDGAAAALARSGVRERCDGVAGSFFDGVPAGGDAYLLKSVLHNWDDERCAAILRRCREAMSPRARLYIVERMLPERLDTSQRHQSMARSDLNMLVALAGRERSEAEFGALLRAAGFHALRRAGSGGEWDVIEARAA